MCGLFGPKQGGGLSLWWQAGLDQTALDLVHAAWARKRDVLDSGRMVRYGPALVWPLFDGPRLVALAYFNPAVEDFPGEASRADAAVLTSRLASVPAVGTLSSYLATGLSSADVVEEVMRDQIHVALEACAGNISMAARQLELSRQAFYLRAAKFNIDLQEIRNRIRGRK